MANLKNITDVPMAESAEGLNLIVNDNGAAKQIAASAVGAQADWAETNESSAAFIKNKPVEEWDLDLKIDITWNSETSEPNEPVFTANDGYSYDAFVAKIEAGDIPNVRIKTDIMTDETIHICEYVKQPVTMYNSDEPMYVVMWFGCVKLSPEVVALTPDGFVFNVM